MRIAATSLLLLVLLSCGDDIFAPHEIAGSYALRAPVTLETAGGAIEIVADTLRLSSDGTALRSVRAIVHGEPPFVLEHTESYTYRIRSDRIEFAFVCPPNALMLCTPPPHIWGQPTFARLVLRHAIDRSVRLEYDRVPTNLRLD